MTRLPEATRLWLLEWAKRRMVDSPADAVIRGLDGNPYLLRWYITPRRKWLPKVYLHKILRSDDDRALHDHPWPNCSILLDGWYVEVLGNNRLGPIPQRISNPGDVVFRRATAKHRLVLPRYRGQVITLFITGWNVRRWGFWCPQGWVHWKIFTQPVGDGRHSRGCE